MQVKESFTLFSFDFSKDETTPGWVVEDNVQAPSQNNIFVRTPLSTLNKRFKVKSSLKRRSLKFPIASYKRSGSSKKKKPIRKVNEEQNQENAEGDQRGEDPQPVQQNESMPSQPAAAGE